MQNKTQGRGYTLLEIMIVVALLVGAVVGVLRLFAMGSVKAATQREQTSISALVDAVRGVYASSPSYAGITMSTVEQQARLDHVLRANGTPVSAFGGTLTLAAATVSAPDDAFAIRINPLNTTACAVLVPALAGQTAQVSTTSGGNIQSKPGVVPNGADIAKACAGAFFQKNQGALTLVYYSPRATGAAARPGPSCAQSCAPQTQTQTLTCPTGLVGQINQTRSGTCSAGACPTQVWSPWTTVSSSCAVAPAPPPPIVPTPPTDPAQSCVPRTETRSLGCPQPQLGRIDQTQAITCDANGSAHVGAWTTVGNTCVAPPPACTDGALTGVDACAAGQFGQVSWVKEMTCTGGGLMIGPKVITGSSCATIGTCRPSRAPDGQKNVACAAGEFGQIIQTLEKTSTCSSATALPVWGPDTVISSTGACAACPVPKTETQSVPCPAGQVGLITQSRSVSYACASAPTSLPAPTYGAWTTTSNTCVVATCTPSGGGVWSVNVISMQVGPIGGTPTSTPYDTVTFNPSTGIAYMQTAPTTSRFLASGNVVFDLTVGAQTQQYTVACTQANSTLNSAGSHITDECLYTGAVTLNGVTLNVTVDASGLPQADYVNGKPAGPAHVQATIAQGGCTPSPAPAPVTNFEIGFWGGYWWHNTKPSNPSMGTCNAPVDGTDPTSGGSTGFNSWVLLNTTDGSADHYVVTMTRKGVTKVVTIPASKIVKLGAASAVQPDGRSYGYQSWGGIFDAPTVYALTPDIDWSQFDYATATPNGGGGITVVPDFRSATVSITACNAAGLCSAPTTQSNGISVWSEGTRECQMAQTGSAPPYPPTAVQ